MLKGLLMMTGIIIVRLIYGKDRKVEGGLMSLALLLSAGFVFWVINLIMLIIGATADDYLLSMVYTVGFPLALIVWGIIVRIRGEYKKN